MGIPRVGVCSPFVEHLLSGPGAVVVMWLLPLSLELEALEDRSSEFPGCPGTGGWKPRLCHMHVVLVGLRSRSADSQLKVFRGAGAVVWQVNALA